jgi:hypothetical protein
MRKKITAGRKTVITEMVLQKLKEAFLIGCTNQEACILANIAESTFYDFLKRNKEFSEQKEGWKTNPILKARITIFENLSKDVKIAMWFLERNRPKEFNPRYINIHDSEENGGELTEEHKAKIKEILVSVGDWDEDNVF